MIKMQPPNNIVKKEFVGSPSVRKWWREQKRKQRSKNKRDGENETNIKPESNNKV